MGPRRPRHADRERILSSQEFSFGAQDAEMQKVDVSYSRAMAKQHFTRLIDDLDGEVLEEGKTIHFSLEGRSYEIDLSEKNAEKLREAFEPFIKAGRAIGSASRTTTRGRSTKKDTRDLGAVREWAAANGHEVSARGRVPAAVLEAYDAAH
ncbi:Lsr2 family protein [Microbacterium binotii]